MWHAITARRWHCRTAIAARRWSQAFGGVDPLPADATFKQRFARRPWLLGQCAGAIEEVKPASAIVEEMVGQAVEMLAAANTFVVPSRL